MVYVYIAHAAEDRAFAAKLSRSLSAASIQNWYAEENSPDLNQPALQEASHLIAVISPAVLLAESALGAMDYARQHQLERLALRLEPVAALPPQLNGVLPLDFTQQGDYEDNLETLVQDLQRGLAPRLPEALLDALHSADPDSRREAINSLVAYRQKDGPLRELAQEELRVMMFRERDPRLRQLLQVSLQAMDLETRPQRPIDIPSKEELEHKSAIQNAALLETDPSPYIVPPPAPPPPAMWQQGWWPIVVAGAGLLLGIVVLLMTMNLGAALLPTLAGILLTPFNATIRQEGAFEWTGEKSALGHGAVSAAGVLLLSLLLAIGFGVALRPLLLGSIVAIGFATVVGWVASQSKQQGA